VSGHFPGPHPRANSRESAIAARAISGSHRHASSRCRTSRRTREEPRHSSSAT
jgi:hypothetical protein